MSCTSCAVPEDVSAEHEDLPSALDNFIYHFFGSVTKTVVDGEVEWTLPCDLDTGITGFPRVEDEGLACYFKRAFEELVVYTAGSGISIVNHVVSISSVPYSTLPVGTTANTVVAGNDSRIVGALQKASNLSDLVSAATARTNLGVGTANAVTFLSVAATSMTVTSAPSNSTDVVNKAYADALTSGVIPQVAVLAATTANITLSGIQTIDGILLVAGNRVLVKNQTSSFQNGIYIVSAGAWTRATDADSSAELAVGHYYFVTSGTTLGGSGWVVFTAPAVLGTDAVVFSQFSQINNYTAGAGISVVGTVVSNTGVTSLAGTANEITVSVPVGTVVLSLPSALTFTGKFITGGTFSGAVFAGTHSGTGAFSTLSATTPIPVSSGGTGGATAAAARTALGLGTMSIQDASAVAITGGSYNGTVGATTPNTGAFTTISSNSNANIRTSKTGLHIEINVKDYGAVGNGSTDDKAAIQSAISALTSYGTLRLSAGRYRLASVLSDISGLNHIKIVGDGAEIFNDTGASGGNTLTFDSTCSHVEVTGINFTGSSSTRGSGVHIRMAADNSSIHHNRFSGCSDFAVLVSQGTNTGWVNNVSVTNNHFGASLGDGCHVGSATNVIVADNQFYSTGDDSIGIIADYAAYAPNRVSVTGNNIFDAGGSGSSGCGIRVGEATDVSIVGNAIYSSREAGIFIGRYTSTTAYNARIFVSSNKLIYTNSSAGMLASISVEFGNDVTIDNNKVEGPINGGGISFLDVNHLSIKNNFTKATPGRGIHSDDGTTTNVATNWGQVLICGNTIDYCGTIGIAGTESIYVTPASGKTISDVIIANNTAAISPGGNYIFTNRLASAAKIVNNVSLEGRTIGTGGIGLAATTANNN